MDQEDKQNDQHNAMDQKEKKNRKVENKEE